MLDNVKGLLGKCWKDVTPDLEPGRHFIDEVITVHLHGTVEKGEDQMVASTVSIPLVPTLALLIEKAGITGDHALRMLREAILEAMDDNTSKNKAIQDRIKNIDTAIAAVKKDLIAKLPKMHRSGRITLKDLEVTVSQPVELHETVAVA